MIENCSSCSTDYPVTSVNAGIVVFLGHPRASHVRATCTHCGAVELLWCAPATLSGLTKQSRLSVVVETEPSEQLRAAADEAWAPLPELPPALPELPREWVRQLHDDLRAFGARPSRPAA